MECISQDLERTFRDLEPMFQNLEYNFPLSVRTLYIKSKNIFSIVFQLFRAGLSNFYEGFSCDESNTDGTENLVEAILSYLFFELSDAI